MTQQLMKSHSFYIIEFFLVSPFNFPLERLTSGLLCIATSTVLDRANFIFQADLFPTLPLFLLSS